MKRSNLYAEMSEKNMASGGEGNAEGSLIDTIVKQLIVLLKNFIWKQIERRSLGDAEMIRKELDAPQLCTPQMQKISQCLQVVGDQVDGDVQSAMTDQTIRPSIDNYIKVVLGIFSDGEINWGRVVTVFSFTCLFVLKAYEDNIYDMIKNIINWTIDYFRNKVVNWIKDQGGWEGIYSYIGTPTWQTVAIFLAGVLTTLFITHNAKRP
ncbi:apoptosis regulator BAX-like isoform X2 [Xiphophorus hellerii]|uniref:apoptosis regulator BAX-like isoform X2 n=1 Tax=Xiphophorus hellerii TaxID=8084 RepID=UPI0013B3D8EA|nr:apoptosis regulator BAX-like isoform X2 [Xiphophorus hellerii]